MSMFEVVVGSEIYLFDQFSEIETFFSEVVMAVGADDAKIEIRLADLAD